MPNTSLRSALDALAQSFASGVLAAIRSASIEDLLAESSGASRRGPGRPARGGTNAGNPKANTTKGGRLARRSAEDIAKAVDGVVALVKQSKTGLRSEEIRRQIGLDVREVPRILKTGVAAKRREVRACPASSPWSLPRGRRESRTPSTRSSGLWAVTSRS